MDSQSKTQTANNILKQTYEIDTTKNQIKTRKELIQEHIEENSSWLDVQSAKEEYERLKKKLAEELGNDGEYNNMLEDLGQLKEKLKSQNETMSDLIVGYRIETGEHQIEMNNQGDAQELIIKGKLGKKAKYQTSLLTGDGNAE